MNADHEVLLFYTAVRWLLKGNVINRVFEMKNEIKLFLEIQERKDLVIHIEDEHGIMKQKQKGPGILSD